MSDHRYFLAVVSDPKSSDYSYGSYDLLTAMRMLDEEYCVLARQLDSSLGYLSVALYKRHMPYPKIRIMDGNVCVGWIWHDFNLSCTPWFADCPDDVFEEIDPDCKYLDQYPSDDPDDDFPF